MKLRQISQSRIARVCTLGTILQRFCLHNFYQLRFYTKSFSQKKEKQIIFSLRCPCGGIALAEIRGNNEACPKISNTSGFSVVHCTQWDISASICKSLGKQLAVPKNLLENNQFHEAAKSLGWFMLGIQGTSKYGWVDASGQSLTFTNWAENFPTDQNPPPEKSVVVVDAEGKWENGWRATELNALCV